MGRPYRTVDPTNEPVSREMVKAHARIAHSDDNEFIDDQIIPMARGVVEDVLGRSLIDQTWQWKNSSFTKFNNGEGSSSFRLPHPPLSSVTSIQYQDSDDVTQTVVTSVYEVDTNTDRVHLKYNQSWPSPRGHTDDVVITWVSGYGADWTAVPAQIRGYVLVLASTYYENREEFIIQPGAVTARLTDMLMAMTGRHRVVEYI